MAGSNFVLSYFALTGRVQRILKDEEFLYYFGFVVVFTIIAAFSVYFKADVPVSDFHPMVLGKAGRTYNPVMV